MTFDEMLSDLQKHYAKDMTDWEQDFIQDIVDAKEALGIRCTVNQYAKVKSIFIKYDENEGKEV